MLKLYELLQELDNDIFWKEQIVFVPVMILDFIANGIVYGF